MRHRSTSRLLSCALILASAVSLGMPPSAEAAKDKPKPREKGSKPGTPDAGVRRILTGERPEHSTKAPEESPELKAMRELDHELFPPVPAPASAPWSTSLSVAQEGAEVDASGLPSKASSSSSKAPEAEDGEDLSWVTKLHKPDFPVRFEPSVVRYLRYYRDNPRGQKLVKAWAKKSGRYRVAVQKLLQKQGLPKDLLWLALVESAFDSTIHSHAGAAGLWQFMPATGRIYGLTVNRRVDERLDPERATMAAARHLADLHKRFGTWELAFAAYNMGYGGVLASIRKYNTNDYWELRRLEAGLPYETALYVPKIMAIAIAMHNCKVFHCEDVTPDPAEPFGEDGEVEGLSVAPGVTLEDVAEAAKIEPDVLAKLNPQVIGSRLPPVELATTARKSWRIYVPKGKAKAAAADIPATGARQSLGTHVVRWGETLDALAAAFGTSKGHLQNLNDLYPHESPRPGTIVFVPAGRTPKAAPAIAATTEPVAVVPDHAFGYQGRRRVFYEPVFGDTVEDVARVAKVTPADVRRWNHLDDQANLQEGMRLQLHVPEDHHPVDALLYEAPEVTVMTVESARFFDHFVGDGRERVEIVAETGDTWKEIGERYGISLGSLERINHRSRRSKLQAGQRVVVYAQRRLLDKLRAEERAAAARQASDVPAATDGSDGSGKIADGTSGGDGPAAAR